MVHAELEDEAVDLLRRHARAHARHEFVQAKCGHLTGLAHAFKSLRSVKTNDAGVFVGGRAGIDVGYHSRTSVVSGGFHKTAGTASSTIIGPVATICRGDTWHFTA